MNRPQFLIPLKIINMVALLALLIAANQPVHAQVPLMINYQGKIEVTDVPYNGAGYFKFSLINDPASPSTNYWTNDGSIVSAGTEPANAIQLPVTLGLFTVKLGDTNLSNMTGLVSSAFTNSTMYLRVWFSTDGIVFEQLTPDRQLVSVPYAMHAETADDVSGTGIVTSAEIADSTITNADISSSAAIAASKINTASATNLVSRILAGTGVSLSPVTGVGDVTITVTGSGAASDVVCTNCVETTDITDGTITTTDLAFDPATQTELDTHKSSSDHDGRYYTETELNTSDGSAPNAGSNRAHWDNLTGVPAGFADGTDDTGAGATQLSGLSDIGVSTATSGNVLIADGTDFNSVVLSGDVTVTSGGVAAVANDSHAHTTTTLSGLDVSDDLNLVAGTNITLTGDTLDVDDAFVLNTGDTITGNLTFNKADPSLILDVTTATDTDFWVGVQEDAGGDDDDVFQIGDGTSPGTNAFVSINTGGDVGIGDPSPDAKLDVHGTIISGGDGQDGQLKVYSEQGGTDYTVTINPHVAMSQDVTLTLPPNDGDASQFLQTDGGGNLVWASPAGSGDVTDVGDCTSGACLPVDGSTHNIGLGTQLVFEGATDNGFETTVTPTDPTVDRTITLPNASGTVAVSASAPVTLSAAGAIGLTQNAGTDVTADLEEEGQINGTAVTGNAADDQVLVGTGASALGYKAMPDCDDAAGNHLNYDTTANAFTCGTSGSGATQLSGLSDIGVSTATSGNVLIADGTDFNSVVLSGDVTVTSGGVAAVANDSHAHTTTTLSGLDVSDDLNLVAGTNITLTGDTLDVDDAFVLNTGDTITGNLTFNKADPSLILDVTTATDTDFWVGVQEDAGGDDDDVFQIGDGTSPGTNAFVSINTGGDVGIGDPSPDAKLDVHGTIISGGDGQDGQLKVYSEQGGTDYTVTINPHVAMSQDVTLTLPPNDGDASQFLQTDGGGNLVWASPAGSGDVTDVGDCTSGACLPVDGSTHNIGLGTQLVFEGASDNGFETTVTPTDPTADRTITLPNASGTVAVSASAPVTLSAAGAIGLTQDAGTDVTADLEEEGKINATAVTGNAADDQILVGTGASALGYKAMPDCDDSAGNHLNYDTTANAFTCGASGSGATQLSELSDIGVSTATSGNVLIADGTDFNSVALSGDVTVTSGGVAAVANDSHAHTTTTLSGLDVSDDLNLIAGTNITLTGDTLDVDDAFVLNTGDTITGNLTFNKADPSIVLDVTTATDTDFWVGVQEDAGGDDDDVFQIGDGTTPGTNAFLSINTSGDVGVGDPSPDAKLDVHGTIISGGDGQDGQLKVYSEQGGTDYTVTLNPHVAMSQDVTLTLPPDDGGVNQFLQTDGGGNLVWATPAGSGDVTDVGDCTSGACLPVDGSTHNIGLGTQLVFEGASDNGFETTVTPTDPTADRTITLPNASGTVAVSASAPVTLSAAGAIGLTQDAGTDVTADLEEEGKINATAVTGNAADDQILVGTGASALGYKAMPDCDDSAGNHLNYDTTANAFTCGASGSGATQLSELSDIGVSTATSGNVLIADGTDFNSVALSGDVTVTSGGVAAVANDSHAHTTTTLSGLDVSDDLNLIAGTNITLTGDTLDVDDAFVLNTGDTITGNLTFNKADPSIVLDVTTATDTDFWVGVQEDAGGDDDDVFQIGDGTTPGTNAFLSINTSGDVGVGDPSPDAKLDVHGTIISGGDGQDGQLKVYSEQGGTDYTVTLNPHVAMSQDVTLTLPPDDGGVNQFLQTDGGGNLVWATPAGSGDVTDVGDCTSGACLPVDGSTHNIGLGTQLVFEGASDNGFETTVTPTDPTADRTITLPNASGTVAVSASAPVTLSAAGAIGLTQDAGTDVTADLEEEGKINATAVTGNAADDQILVGTGASALGYKAMPDCDDSAGNHLNYDTTANAFTCGASGSGATQLSELSDIGVSTATSGNVLIADGTDFNSVALSGDVTVTSGGVAAVANDSHAHTTTTLSGLDVSDDLNLIAGTNITLTGDTLDVDDSFLLNTGDVGTGVYDFGGATSFEIPNATAPSLTADGQIALETDADAINIQAGSGAAGGIPANTDVAIPLIQQKDITLVEPDQIQTVSDAIPMFAVDSYNYPNGITIRAIRLATSASSTLAINVEEWTSPTDGSPATIDAIATSASTETTETTITDAAVAAGSYVFLDLDTIDVNWVKVTVWYYVND